jgi:signal transduction histidine kinase
MTRERAVSLPEGQADLLEMIAKGAPLAETLTHLTLLIESQSEGLFCSILLLDPDGIHIRAGAGPNLPTEYMQALDGLPIGPRGGSCGAAMFRKEAVTVTDIFEDPLWEPYRDLIAPHGFHACWSTPIFLDRETVLGSFAMYYRTVRSPGPAELRLIAVATHIAGIAIERKRNEDQLHRYQHELENLVKTRTAELQAEKEKAESAVVALSHANLELASALNYLSAAQEELVRSKKLASLGSMVAGISHELNTPIGNCMMASSSLADQTKVLGAHFDEQGSIKRSQLETYLERARKAEEILSRNLHRAGDLINAFKQMAMDQTSSSRRDFMLDKTLEEVLSSVASHLKKTPYVIKQDLAEDLPLDSYPGPLGQVLTSLIDNSILHGFEGRNTGTIVVSTQADWENEGWVIITVKDDGVGIPSENVDRVFDPFFTTKLGKGGSGIGLNVAYNIVTSVLGGQIQAHSEPDHGTVFTIRLPMTAPQLGAQAAS